MDASDAERWDLLLRHRDAVVSIVRRRVRNTAEAEDCVHDAMLRLARRTDLDPDRVRSLLTKVAVGLAIDHYRSTQRRDRAVVRLGGSAVAEAISPEDVLADQAEVERILAVVDALPRRERQVLRLRISGWGVSDVARLLRLSYKTVEGAYTRARQHVRRGLESVLAWLGLRRRLGMLPGEASAVAGVAALVFLLPILQGLLGLAHDDHGRTPTGSGDSTSLRWGGSAGVAPSPAAPARSWAAWDGPGAEPHGAGPGSPSHRDGGQMTIVVPIDVEPPPPASPHALPTYSVTISGIPPDVSTDPNVIVGGLETCEAGVEYGLQHGFDTERSIC